MKIAFWSCVPGQTGTTSNIMAVSIMSILLHQCKNALMESHHELNSLEEPLIGNKMNSYDIGIDALARSIKSAPLDEKTVVNSSISLLNKQLSLVLGSRKSRELYERDMDVVFNRIVDEMQKYHSNVFIDVCSGKNELSDSILSNADLVVVNLSQNKQIINEYFKDDTIDSGKVIYLIGNYNYNSRYNMKNLIKLYPKFNKNNLAVIPYNVEFMDSQYDGKAIEFMIKNYECSKKDHNYDFIKAVKNAVQLIMARFNQEDMIWQQ